MPGRSATIRQDELHLVVTALTVIAIVFALIPGLVLGMAFENQSIAAGSRILRFFRII